MTDRAGDLPSDHTCFNGVYPCAACEIRDRRMAAEIAEIAELTGGDGELDDAAVGIVRWAIKHPKNGLLASTSSSSAEAATKRFTHARSIRRDWAEWQAKGYTVVRVRIVEESGS